MTCIAGKELLPQHPMIAIHRGGKRRHCSEVDKTVFVPPQSPVEARNEIQKNPSISTACKLSTLGMIS